LRRYTAFVGEAAEGAVLVFAFTHRQAVQLAWPVIRYWHCDIAFIDIRARWIKNAPWLDKLNTTGAPCVIEDPPTCARCEWWGGEPLTTGCSFCDHLEDNNLSPRSADI